MLAQRTDTKKSTNPLDAKMTPAQIARRKFKASLPRKTQDRLLTPMEALAELFSLMDRFRGMVAEQNGDPSKAVHAALAYYLPKSKNLAEVTNPLPEPMKIGRFCDEVMKLERPAFLGVVFIHVDGDTKKAAYGTVSFCVPFMSGPEAASRLLFAQKTLIARVEGLRPHKA